MQFDIKLKSQDMYRFNMYQTYTGFHGWFSIIVSIIIFIVAGLTYGGLDITYTVLYIAFGIIFLLYMPGSDLQNGSDKKQCFGLQHKDQCVYYSERAVGRTV